MPLAILFEVYMFICFMFYVLSLVFENFEQLLKSKITFYSCYNRAGSAVNSNLDKSMKYIDDTANDN